VSDLPDRLGAARRALPMTWDAAVPGTLLTEAAETIEALEGLVWALVAVGRGESWDGSPEDDGIWDDGYACALCGNLRWDKGYPEGVITTDLHPAHCVWRRAVEWVEAHTPGEPA